MATLPSSPQSNTTGETKQVSSKEVSRINEKSLNCQPLQSIPVVQKEAPERQANANSQVPLPGTYYLKTHEARGKHMVQYVYADVTDPNDESLPFHIRERYNELQKERLLRYQQSLSPRGTRPTRQHETTNTLHHLGIRLPRPASANHGRRTGNDPNENSHRSSKYITDIGKEASHTKSNQKFAMKHVQQTRSSNTVLSPKRDGKSGSKASSPRPRTRRPFSIAAESTSDTDPIDVKRSVETIPHRSPPRTPGSKQARRQQYLATKFKLAAKNSKHTQTFVAAVASVEDSSGSATTVISRQNSTTQTGVMGKNVADSISNRPDYEGTGKPEEKDTVRENQDPDPEKLSIVPQHIIKSEGVFPTSIEKAQDSLEWQRAKVRLRSTPRSPSPPLRESQHRVASADWVRVPSKEKLSCLTGRQPASGHSGLTSRLIGTAPPPSERQFTTSATQIEQQQTANIGVQVKLRKNRSSSRKGRRSPSQRSAYSKISSQSVGKANEDTYKAKKNKSKKKKKKSRDPSIRSPRSLRSFQSDASAGILKHVKIGKSGIPPSGRSTSLATLGETGKKKKKGKAKKKRKSSNKIARFLRTLSKDKDAIKVISKMAAIDKKRRSK